MVLTHRPRMSIQFSKLPLPPGRFTLHFSVIDRTRTCISFYTLVDHNHSGVQLPTTTTMYYAKYHKPYTFHSRYGFQPLSTCDIYLRKTDSTITIPEGTFRFQDEDQTDSSFIFHYCERRRVRTAKSHYKNQIYSLANHQLFNTFIYFKLLSYLFLYKSRK